VFWPFLRQLSSWSCREPRRPGAVEKFKEVLNLDPSRQFRKDELAKVHAVADAMKK
jgi:hypothetical protein